MKWIVGLSLAALVGCGAPGGGFPPQTMIETRKIPADKRIELSLEPGTFAISEVEFHVGAESLPDAILNKARKLMPGARVDDCEIEYHGGKVFYEVTCVDGGVEKEGHVSPSGVNLIAGSSRCRRARCPRASSKPRSEAWRARSSTRPSGSWTGGKNLLEYHFKLSRDGREVQGRGEPRRPAGPALSRDRGRDRGWPLR